MHYQKPSATLPHSSPKCLPHLLTPHPQFLPLMLRLDRVVAVVVGLTVEAVVLPAHRTDKARVIPMLEMLKKKTHWLMAL
jgi:hypothetical protein